MVSDYSFVLFFVILVLGFGKNTLNFHQHSSEILNYWTNHNNLELKTLWPTSFLRKIHTLILQLDVLCKSSPNRAFYKIIAHNQVQMYNLPLFSSIPNLEYLYQDHSKVNRIVSQNQEHQLVFKFSWFVKLIASQETNLHAYIIFYHQLKQLRANN